MHTRCLKPFMFFIYLLLCSWTVGAYAGPTISSVTGNFRDRQLLTISGSSFSIKNPAKPIIWADFENGNINPSDLGQRTNWSVINNNLLITNNCPPGDTSKYCVVGTWENGKKSFSFRIDKTYWSKIYHYQKRYYDFTVTDNQKFWRLWPVSGGNDFVAIWHGASGTCYNEIEGYVGGNVGGYQGSAPSKDVWHIEEFTWQHHGGSGLDRDGVNRGRGTGVWDYTRDGVQIQHRENVNNGENNQVQLRTDNFTDSGNLAPEGSHVYMDDIYIDDTYAHVMMGNAPTLSGSTHREIQIPTAWNDTSITVVFNQGSFKDGDTAYLFVVDKDGNVSNGYPITIGGESGEPQDNPPSVSIATPTSEDMYSTSDGIVTISGTASDDNGISTITWSNNRGGNGTATNSSGDWSEWSISDINLQEGENVITITATDTNNQTATDTITVTYTPSDMVQAWSANDQTNDTNWKDSSVTYCVRLLIEGAQITRSGNQIMLGFKGRSSGDYTIRKVSIAEKDPNGGEGDVIDSTWTKVTFDGKSTSTWGTDEITIPAGQEKLSDPVNFTIEPGKDYYVTFKIVSPSVYLNPPSTYKELYFWTDDHASDIDWSENGHTTTQDYHALSSIYILSSSNDSTPPTTPQNFSVE